LKHSDAKVLVVDRQLHVEVKKALNKLDKKIIVIDIHDKFADQSKLEKIGDLEYESFLIQVMIIIFGKCQKMSGRLYL
jgi:fatty-acyl-CoA synthase